MPSVTGSPTRQYTPPSSNDESGRIPFFNHTITSTPCTTKQSPSSPSFHLQDHNSHHHQQQSMSPPSSSSDDSPTTSADNNTFLQDDTEMLDYDYQLGMKVESPPEAMFFGGARPSSSRFNSTQGSPGFFPFTASLASLRPSHSSPEFDGDGDSPGIRSEMHGLRINSRFPSPVQGTVRLEDVMLPMEDGMSSMIPATRRSLFENKVEVQHVGNGSFQSLPYTLALVGIPPQGAKSRVETQIKLDLQLLHSGSEDLAKGAYDYLKLPSYGVSKEKFRLPNLKDAPKDITADKILHLEASVVCTTQPTKAVFICEGCILRERKRALRKKDYKRKTNKRPPPSPPLPADENQKIIVFNCPEVIDFSSGTCSLPTRITCYCRHHKEKLGFKIVLVVKDSLGTVIGQCVSGNIMITDDHKAQSGKIGDEQPVNKRRSSEEGRPTSGFTSRRSSMDSIDSQVITSGGRKRKLLESTSFVPSVPQLPTPPMSSTPLSTQKQVKIPRNLSMTKLNKLEPMSTPVKQTPQPNQYPLTPASTFMRTQSMDSVPTFFSAQSSNPSNTGRWQVARQTSVTAPNSRSNSPPEIFFNTSAPIQTFDNDFPPPPTTPFSVGIQSAPVSNAASPEESTALSTFQQWHESVPGITIPSDLEDSRPLIPSPIISKMVPTEGPTSGGIEVTILGQGFTQGIIAQFGEVTAIPTECYSSTTLVCLLPPSPTPGPVFVTLKDAFGRPVTDASRIEQQQLFTYVNATDRALMELALQIMGFKWLGKLEDARNVAAMIIGNHGASNVVTGDVGGSAGLENTLLRCLDVIDMDTSPHPARLAQRSKTGHTMLHFAAMAGMRRLVAGLLVRGVNPAITDFAGFTALHYAAWLGRGKVVQRLLSGDNAGLLAMKTLEGKTPEELAVESGRVEIVQLLSSPSIGLGTLSRASSLASLAGSLSRASLSEYFAGSEWDGSDSSSDNNLDDQDDGELWLGSLRNETLEPPTPTNPSVVQVVVRPRARRFFQLRPQLPDPQALNPALYVAALNDLLQPYLQALRLTNNPTSDSKHSSTLQDEKKYDLPPPAYSELYPVQPAAKEKFSLATRLSLRGRSFLRWTGMAGDAGLSPQEIEFLHREDRRRTAGRRDYMLFFFWIPVLVCILGFTFVKGINVFRESTVVREVPALKRIVEKFKATAASAFQISGDNHRSFGYRRSRLAKILTHDCDTTYAIPVGHFSAMPTVHSRLNEKYHIFHPGQTVIDLGFAPGSWTQVAVSKTRPNGRVLGLDILPCPAPSGASAMQGNFLSKQTQQRIKAYLADPLRGRPVVDRAMVGEEMGYIDMAERDHNTENTLWDGEKGVVDVVLSDMSEPWPQTEGFWKNYLTEAYFRMMNVTGIRVKDHGDSMDLCDAATLFAIDVLKNQGTLLMKFYTGSEDKALEMRLKKVFEKVKREKPEASRDESREMYFVCLRKRLGVRREDILKSM